MDWLNDWLGFLAFLFKCRRITLSLEQKNVFATILLLTCIERIKAHRLSPMNSLVIRLDSLTLLVVSILRFVCLYVPFCVSVCGQSVHLSLFVHLNVFSVLTFLSQPFVCLPDICVSLATISLSVCYFSYLHYYHNNEGNNMAWAQARTRRNHYSYEHECWQTTSNNHNSNGNTL